MQKRDDWTWRNMATLFSLGKKKLLSFVRGSRTDHRDGPTLTHSWQIFTSALIIAVICREIKASAS